MADTGVWILWECDHLENIRTREICRAEDFKWLPIQNEERDIKKGQCHHCRKKNPSFQDFDNN